MKISLWEHLSTVPEEGAFKCKNNGISGFSTISAERVRYF